MEEWIEEALQQHSFNANRAQRFLANSMGHAAPSVEEIKTAAAAIAAGRWRKIICKIGAKEARAKFNEAELEMGVLMQYLPLDEAARILNEEDRKFSQFNPYPFMGFQEKEE